MPIENTWLTQNTAFPQTTYAGGNKSQPEWLKHCPDSTVYAHDVYSGADVRPWAALICLNIHCLVKAAPEPDSRKKASFIPSGWKRPGEGDIRIGLISTISTCYRIFTGNWSFTPRERQKLLHFQSISLIEIDQSVGIRSVWTALKSRKSEKKNAKRCMLSRRSKKICSASTNCFFLFFKVSFGTNISSTKLCVWNVISPDISPCHLLLILLLTIVVISHCPRSVTSVLPSTSFLVFAWKWIYVFCTPARPICFQYLSFRNEFSLNISETVIIVTTRLFQMTHFSPNEVKSKQRPMFSVHWNESWERFNILKLWSLNLQPRL